MRRTVELVWHAHTRDRQLIDLFDRHLADNKTDGVYLIYRAGGWKGFRLVAPQVIRVGQGRIGARIVAHRGDMDVIRHESSDRPLKVAFAMVIPQLRDGVERYLVDFYRPLVAHDFPDVDPVPVTRPFAA